MGEQYGGTPGPASSYGVLTAKAGFTSPDLVANIAFIAVWSFGVVIAVNQMVFAQTLVNTLFTGLLARSGLLGPLLWPRISGDGR